MGAAQINGRGFAPHPPQAVQPMPAPPLLYFYNASARFPQMAPMLMLRSQCTPAAVEQQLQKYIEEAGPGHFTHVPHITEVTQDPFFCS